MTSTGEIHRFLTALDEADFEVSDWEAQFIGDMLGKRRYTPRQLEFIAMLKGKYGRRLGKEWAA